VTRSRLGAFLLLLAAFVAGGVVGGVVTEVLAHRGRHLTREGAGRSGFLTRLSEQLDLTAVQQDSIRAVVRRFDPVMDSLWREVRPRFDSARAVLREAIRAQLTEEQRQRYDDMMERREREYRRGGGRSNGRR
jgi:Spy/CpxP family protein refolding chaperone